ncbi:MAG: hypothetical protein KY448_05990, partial [Cyanobacteria bacterium 0813]|nr:hypothetical protein [Cyanobacteria bacterium 0813]
MTFDPVKLNTPGRKCHNYSPGRTSGQKPGLMDDRTSLSATDSLTGLSQKSRRKWRQTGTGKRFDLE